jgi:shikimate dehydrogenase
MSTRATRLLAVVGDPVAHSLSPAMHNAAIRALGLDARYVALRTTTPAFPELVRGMLADGGALNVTTPFKHQAAELAARPSDAVRRTGACNTIWGDPEAARGDNTDVAGIRAAALELLGTLAPRRVLIHGTGASARSAAVAVADEWPQAAVQVASRVRARAEAFARWARGAGMRCALWTAADPSSVDLLISATPAGPAGANEEPAPDPERETPPVLAMLDLVYTQGETPAVRQFRRLGARAADGRGVLVAQGAAAFERFFGVKPPVDLMRAAVDDALRP